MTFTDGESPEGSQAVVIPVDLSLPIHKVTLTEGTTQIKRIIGGDGGVEGTRYDHDATMWVSGNGRLVGQPNLRATKYIATDSSRAAHIRDTWLHSDPGYGLYGDVVVTGGGPDDQTDAPRRFLEMTAATPAPTQRVVNDRNNGGRHGIS